MQIKTRNKDECLELGLSKDLVGWYIKANQEELDEAEKRNPELEEKIFKARQIGERIFKELEEEKDGSVHLFTRDASFMEALIMGAQIGIKC